MGNKILLNPMLFEQLTKPSFNFETRNYPLEFGTAMNKSTLIKIKIPEGYKVESLPEDKQFLVEGNKAGYAYKIEVIDDIIQVSTVYQIVESILPSTFYKPMKEFEKQQISAEAQQVVLEKI